VLNGAPDGRVPISSDTRKRVLAAIADLGYEPDARAQALRSGSTKTIAFIMPDIRNPHFAEYAVGIEQEAHLAGYHVLISSTSLKNEYAIDIFKDLARRRIDGLILGSSFILESKVAQAILAQVKQRGTPVVELNDLYGVDSVYSDYRDATGQVMEYLFSLGHRRIGLIYGVGGHELAEDRRQPYLDSLSNAGIPFDPDLVAECGPEIEDGYRAAEKLLRLAARPTAIIMINDLLAFGALRAAADLGLRIPEDLSLVGYDDVPMANYLIPRLTTVSKDNLNLGKKAFSTLLNRIQNPELPRQVYYHPAKLIIRESTGPAPAQT
jgi:LacI family transcriptional regulator